MRMMQVHIWLLVLMFAIDTIVCPPVNVKKPDNEERVDDDVSFGLEYERYLKEVVGVLESDEVFRKKLQESNVSEIKFSNMSHKLSMGKSGEIARHLEFVSHNIRTKLDEIKRKEIDRLRQVMKLRQQIQRGENDPEFLMLKNRVLAHVDHKNPSTFEVEDLAKLIKKASQDLEDIDKQRRSEFKRYELEKEVEQREKLAHMDEEHRKEEMKKLEEMKKKHADHPKIHHPISKDQLEEVWEESDGMEKEDFDPKTFFALHDQNGDMVLDEAEVEALFQKELDKVYDPKNPEDDLIERYEEMNRMREHVFKEVDTNGDKLISLEEFLKSTQSEDFEKDEGWDTLDEQKVYTDEELEQFVREYEERERQELERQGHAPPLDPSQQPPIVRDNLVQQGQGQQVHMEQQQPIQNQQAGNMPNQGIPVKPHQNIEQVQQHVEPPEHAAQHQQEQPHIEPMQHVQHQQEQLHFEPVQHLQQQQQQQQRVEPMQQQHQQVQQHVEPPEHAAQHQEEQPHIEPVQHVQHQQEQVHLEPVQHVEHQQPQHVEVVQHIQHPPQHVEPQHIEQHQQRNAHKIQEQEQPLHHQQPVHHQ